MYCLLAVIAVNTLLAWCCVPSVEHLTFIAGWFDQSVRTRMSALSHEEKPKPRLCTATQLAQTASAATGSCCCIQHSHRLSTGMPLYQIILLRALLSAEWCQAHLNQPETFTYQLLAAFSKWNLQVLHAVPICKAYAACLHQGSHH